MYNDEIVSGLSMSATLLCNAAFGIDADVIEAPDITGALENVLIPAIASSPVVFTTPEIFDPPIVGEFDPKLIDCVADAVIPPVNVFNPLNTFEPLYTYDKDGLNVRDTTDQQLPLDAVHINCKKYKLFGSIPSDALVVPTKPSDIKFVP